jgi:hypothetical protein
MSEPLTFHTAEFWVKVVEMLQQNWALIEDDERGGTRVYFINDTGGVFDEMGFSSVSAAVEALGKNGFRRFAANPELQSFLRPPSSPFRRSTHPNGPIYSSGRFFRR